MTEPKVLPETDAMAAAVKLFEMGQLSSGAAARLAGVPRTVFLYRLADYGVDTFDLTNEELMRETRRAVICRNERNGGEAHDGY